MSRFKDVYELEWVVKDQQLKRAQGNLQGIRRQMNAFKGQDLMTNRFSQNLRNVRLPSQVNQRMAAMNDHMATSINRLNSIQSNTQRAAMQATSVGRAWEQSKMGVLGFNGTLLSTLFFGMALKNTFQRALTSIFDSYKKIIPENSKFNKEVTKLSANWEYFKFQLADALVKSKVFDVMIAGAVKLLNWFNSLSDGTQKWLVILTGVGFILGGALMLIGLIGLGVAGVVDGLLAMGVTAAGIKTTLKGMFLPANKGITYFKRLDKIVKTFSASLSTAWKGIKGFFKGMSIGNVKSFGALISKVKSLFTNLFSSLGGKISSLWASLQTVFKSGWKAAAKGFLSGALKGIKGLIKKIPIIGWIIIAIETVFKSVQDFMNSQTTSWLGVVISTISSVAIRAIESIITFFTSLVDIIVNVVAWVVEKVAGALGFEDINIPKLDLSGVVNDFADKLVDATDSAAVWVEEQLGMGKFDTSKYKTPNMSTLDNVSNVSKPNNTPVVMNTLNINGVEEDMTSEQKDQTSQLMREILNEKGLVKNNLSTNLG